MKHGVWLAALVGASLPCAQAQTDTPASRSGELKFAVEVVHAEAEFFQRDEAPDRGLWLRVEPGLKWQPARGLEVQATLQLEAYRQSGDPNYSDTEVEPADSFVRWRRSGARFTLGAQTAIWGRIDETPLIDRVSRVDLTRGPLDSLEDRRSPNWALRWEQSWGDLKSDVMLLPHALGARLPDERSVWSPVNPRSGEIVGIDTSPELRAFVRGATIKEDVDGAGGAAVRMTRTGVPPFDFGATLGRVRQPLPYYRADLADNTLTAVYPWQTFAGVDVEWVNGGQTWRSELVVTDGVPATAPDGRMRSGRSIEWAAGLEMFPGGGETRLNLQLVARHVDVDGPTLELKRYVGVNGEIESSFDQGRWKFGIRFAGGLNVHDTYLSPKLSYVGWEPHEFYVAAHVFSGAAQTFGGYYRDNDLIAVGVKTRF
jgi:hypothetical protein